jgi:hypothetical protein
LIFAFTEIFQDMRDVIEDSIEEIKLESNRDQASIRPPESKQKEEEPFLLLTGTLNKLELSMFVSYWRGKAAKLIRKIQGMT